MSFCFRESALVVFCDFDGTITERDMVVTICEKFCPPDNGRGSPSGGPPIWKTVVQDILSRKKTVKDGVAELFALIPSSKKDEMIAYAHDVMKLRAGFPEFLEFCKTNGILFTVCSGGIDFFVEPLMAPYAKYIHKLYSIPSDFSGPTITLRHTHACETCGTCKAKIMADYPNATKILIGDSITDLHGAHHADVVFARAGLKDYLDQDKVSYHAFETFFDVIDTLKSFEGQSCPPPHSPARSS